jgi:hypothetical protein
MPVINIYLSKELFELVKLNKSKIIQEALRQYKEKLEHLPNPSCDAIPKLNQFCALPEPIKESG